MPGEFFYMALGGLGVSLAGFAGVISALDRRPGPASPSTLWRVRNVVLAGFTLTVVGFGVIAVHAATDGDVPLTVRIASGFVIAANGLRILTEMRPGPAWPGDSGRYRAIAIELVLIAGFLVAAITARPGLFQLLLIGQLGFPLSVFLFTVEDATRGGPAVSSPEP
jgi:hypothetical protein